MQVQCTETADEINSAQVTHLCDPSIYMVFFMHAHF